MKLVTAALLFVCLTAAHNVAGVFEIQEPPSSLLIPVHEGGIFTCTAECTSQCFGRWLINDELTHTLSNVPRPELLSMGFEFPTSESDGTHHTIFLKVNASEGVNNTKITCHFSTDGQPVLRRDANLTVIAACPLSRNPMVINNSTHVTVAWSPPYLWPGQAILHYNVSFTNMSDGSVNLTSLESTYNDPMVTHTMPVPLEVFACTEIVFGISAVASSGQLETFHASSYIAPNRIVFDSSSIDVSSTVLYSLDGSPALLDVHIEILQDLVCSSQELNYTLLIEEEGALQQVVGRYGPVLRRGPSVVVLMSVAASNLTGGHNYSLKVQVGLELQSITTNKHHFSTATFKASSQTTPPFISSDTGVVSEREDGNSSSAVFLGVMIIALIMVVVMAVGIVSLAVCMYTSRKQKRNERTCSDSKRRVFNTMVPNPIYSAEEEGPVYDSIRPQYETLVAVSPQSLTERNLGDSGEEKADTVDSVRYIDQPVHVSTLRSQSFAHTISDTSGAIPPRSFSVSNSGPPVRPMALKRNGQERNKLHLTLDLCEGEVDRSEASGLRPVSGNGSETQEESYMVMNPVQSN